MNGAEVYYWYTGLSNQFYCIRQTLWIKTKFIHKNVFTLLWKIRFSHLRKRPLQQRQSQNCGGWIAKCAGQRKSIRRTKEEIWIWCEYFGMVWSTSSTQLLYKRTQKGKNGTKDFKTTRTRTCYIFIARHSSSKWNKWKSTSGSPRLSKRKIQKRRMQQKQASNWRIWRTFISGRLAGALECWSKKTAIPFIRVDASVGDKLNLRIYCEGTNSVHIHCTERNEWNEGTNEWQCECACFITPRRQFYKASPNKWQYTNMQCRTCWHREFEFFSGIHFLFSRYICGFFCSFKFKTFPYIGDDEILMISQCST